jgi:hypothetical protein
MRVGNLLLGCAFFAALLFSGRATAQTEDDFAGGFKSSVPWRWDVPGNTPVNTEDPANYTFSSNAINITAQSGSLYASQNNARNIPNLLIVDQPDNWYVETAVKTDWSMASTDVYIQAGLIFLADADNYFSFYYNRDAANAPSVQVSSTFEVAGTPGYGGTSSGDWAPTTDYVKLRVEGTPTDITFLVDHTGTFEVAGFVDSRSQPDLFAFLSSLLDMRVGLETDSGGGSNTSPFSFSYFKTNLLVTQLEDDFLGGFNPSIPWTWNIPGNNPVDTEDPSHYVFTSNSLDITVQGGSTYGANNTAHNMPNFIVLGQPDYWFVETAVSTDWSMASEDRYVHAGLVFLGDADNYYSFYTNRNAATGHTPKVQVSTTIEVAASPNYGNISSGDWDPTTDPVKLRVEGSPTEVKFLYNHTGTWQVAGRASSATHPDVYALVSSLVGMHVCLETDSGGGVSTSPFSFKYLTTNLIVSQ